MNTDLLKYPVGVQSFAALRMGGYLYVDKTGFVYKMANGPKSCFLSRPRRFGKSLLVSTLEAYFEGKRELFTGLEITELERHWNSYPVLRLDMSLAQSKQHGGLRAQLLYWLNEQACRFGVTVTDMLSEPGPLFGDLIKKVSQKCNSQVVVLIDEYDKALLDTQHDHDLFEENRNTLQPFFQQIKSQDEFLRFSFMTGVSRFRHVTLFSGVNNISDISMHPHYAAICGITEEELLRYFNRGIAELSESCGSSSGNMVDRLRAKYDGYRFTRSNEMVYNPFSLLNVFQDLMLKNYWAMSGITSSLIGNLEHTHLSISDLTQRRYTEEQLSDLFDSKNPVSLFFQTGYLTVRDFEDDTYLLGIPNEEVNQTLVRVLMPYYMHVRETEVNDLLAELKSHVQRGEVDRFMILLKSLLSRIPYQIMDIANMEKHYHSLLYLVFMMVGLDTQAEISISGGRIDMVCETQRFVYIFEFKLDSSAEEAIRQIDEKGYTIPWNANCHKEIIKVGCSFSSTLRTINNWIIKR